MGSFHSFQDMEDALKTPEEILLEEKKSLIQQVEILEKQLVGARAQSRNNNSTNRAKEMVLNSTIEGQTKEIKSYIVRFKQSQDQNYRQSQEIKDLQEKLGNVEKSDEHKTQLEERIMLLEKEKEQDKQEAKNTIRHLENEQTNLTKECAVLRERQRKSDLERKARDEQIIFLQQREGELKQTHRNVKEEHNRQIEEMQNDPTSNGRRMQTQIDELKNTVQAANAHIGKAYTNSEAEKKALRAEINEMREKGVSRDDYDALQAQLNEMREKGVSRDDYDALEARLENVMLEAKQYIITCPDGTILTQGLYNQGLLEIAQLPTIAYDGSQLTQQGYDQLVGYAQQTEKENTDLKTKIITTEDGSELSQAVFNQIVQAKEASDKKCVEFEKNAVKYLDGSKVSQEEFDGINKAARENYAVKHHDGSRLTQDLYNLIIQAGKELQENAAKKPDGTMLSQEEYEKLLQDYKKLSEEKADVQKKCNDLEQDVQRLQTESHELKQHVKELETASGTQDRRIHTLEKQSDVDNKELERQKKDLVLKDQKLHEKEQQLKEQGRKLTEREQTLEDGKVEYTNLKTRLDQETKQHDTLKDQHAKAEDELAKLRDGPPDLAADKQRLKKDLTRSASLTKKQDQEIETLEGSHGELVTKLAEAEASKLELEQQLARRELYIKKADEENSKIKLEHRKCTGLKESLDKEIKDLAMNLRRKGLEANSCSSEATRWSGIAKERKVLLTTATEKVKELEKKLSKLQGEKRTLENRKDEIEDELEEVRENAENLLKVTADLKKDAKSCEKVMKTKEQEIVKLKSRLERIVDPKDPAALIPITVTDPAGQKSRLTLTDTAGQKPQLTPITEEDEEDDVQVNKIPKPNDVADRADESAASLPVLSNEEEMTSRKSTDASATSAIEPVLRQDKRREAGCASARKANIACLVLVLLLVFFGVSMLVTWWRKYELLSRGDNYARLAMLSLRAGGGTGTAWPSWLYDDELVEVAGGLYG